MVRIRLRRVGSKKQPAYRVVVTDSSSPRDGRFIEKIGFYNPRTQPATVQLNEPRALYWLSVGAQPSDAVRRMMDKAGTIGRYDRLRKGEAMEALVAEAQAAGSPEIDPRTRRDDITSYPKKSKAKAKLAAKAGAPAKADVEAPAEAEPEAAAEEVAEPTVEAVAEPADESSSEGETETPAE